MPILAENELRREGDSQKLGRKLEDCPLKKKEEISHVEEEKNVTNRRRHRPECGPHKSRQENQ